METSCAWLIHLARPRRPCRTAGPRPSAPGHQHSARANAPTPAPTSSLGVGTAASAASRRAAAWRSKALSHCWRRPQAATVELRVKALGPMPGSEGGMKEFTRSGAVEGRNVVAAECGRVANNTGHISRHQPLPTQEHLPIQAVRRPGGQL